MDSLSTLNALNAFLQQRGYYPFRPLPLNIPSKRLVVRALSVLARSAGMEFEPHLARVIPYILGIICGPRLPENEGIYIDAFSTMESIVAASRQILLDYVDVDTLAAIITSAIKGGRKPNLSVKLAVFQLAAKLSKSVIVPESVNDFHALIMPLGRSCGLVESSDNFCKLPFSTMPLCTYDVYSQPLWLTFSEKS